MHSGECVVPFNTHCWANWIFTCEIMKLDPCLTPPHTHKLAQDALKTQTCNPKPLNSEEHTGEGLSDARLSNDFAGGTPKGQATKAKTQGLLPRRKHYTAKGMITRGKTRSLEWEEIFANHVSDPTELVFGAW